MRHTAFIIPFALLLIENVSCYLPTRGRLILQRSEQTKSQFLKSQHLKMSFDSFTSNSGMFDMSVLSIPSTLSLAEAEYSKLSLYFTLFLYVLSVPGLFSLVSRSVKVKPVQKIYDLPGPANPTAKSTRQTAGEVMAYFKAMNYEMEAAEEVITFKGLMGRSKSQAYFLTFCTFMGLGSLGLILSILLPDLGSNAYFLTLLSPYAGIYYWNNAQRIDEVKIKMETSDDDQTTSIVAQGGKEDLERFSKTLNLPERGKVYVRGMFESDAEVAVQSTGSE